MSSPDKIRIGDRVHVRLSGRSFEYGLVALIDRENPKRFRYHVNYESGGGGYHYRGALTITSKASKKPAQRPWPHRKAFIEYLTTTLIPDLKASGSTCTAEDFETAVEYLQADQRALEDEVREAETAAGWDPNP